jgi:membrane protein
VTPLRELPGRVTSAVHDGVRRARRRSAALDHLARAFGRYDRSQGDLLAAGVTYFAFLGLFPVLLLIASVIGFVLRGNQLLQDELVQTVLQTIPGPAGRAVVHELQDAVASAGVVGVVGLLGFVYTGLRTMDKLRIGMETIWRGRPDRPEFLRDNLQDLLALVALGAVGLVSLAFTGFATQATGWVLDLLGLSDAVGVSLLSSVLGIVLALLVDLAVFLWLLKVVPANAFRVRRLLPGAVFGAVGFELLKVVGSVYLSLVSGSVTASALGTAVGILVWINVVARFAFFTAAWTVTLPGLDPQTAAGWQPVWARRSGVPADA